MSKQAIMSWVDALPGVEKTDFQAKRDEIAALVKQAEELVKQAEELRGQAYFASLRLEGEAKAHWSTQQVEQIKAGSGW
ncbi:stable inheritance protein KleA [Escherichia coli]|jgi:uncharacterized protein KleA/KleC|uniref:KleA protein n=2 Tax=root TaxID=1 RepID=F2Q6B9_9BACT|nr:KleA [Plasmid pMCBF1]ABO36610.1 KleA protein [uncultured bacterium pMCBF6]EDC6278234.1 protein kleA [Salmonella enterica subsp. enterica serovar Enteritidis]